MSKKYGIPEKIKELERTKAAEKKAKETQNAK